MQEAVKQLDKIKNFNCSGLIQVFLLPVIQFAFPSLVNLMFVHIS
jgi:hypothetical protein